MLTVGMNCGGKEDPSLMEGEEKELLMTHACSPARMVMSLRCVKADHGKRRKLKFQVYKFMYRMSK